MRVNLNKLRRIAASGMLSSMILVRTDVSEESVSLIIRVKKRRARDNVIFIVTAMKTSSPTYH
jgi:hypothetical protein